jgi:hypothetical protein
MVEYLISIQRYGDIKKYPHISTREVGGEENENLWEKIWDFYICFVYWCSGYCVLLLYDAVSYGEEAAVRNAKQGIL